MNYQRKDPLDYKDIAENLKNPAWWDLENGAILLDDAATAITELLASAESAEAENRDREETSFREHADTHFWRDRARAAEKCIDDIRWARNRTRPAYVVDEIIRKFYEEKAEEQA